MEANRVSSHKIKSSLNLIAFAGALAASVAGLGALTACSNGSAEPNIVFKETKPNPQAMAKIGDQVISEDELMGNAKLDFFEIKKREYELRMNRLNELMVEKLIGAEAEKAKLGLDEFISKKVTKGDIKVSESDYNNFIKERKVPESRLTPELKERIMGFLKEQKKQDMVQAYVAKLTKKNPVEVYFQKPRLEMNVEVGKSPVWGKADAPVTIVEFSDFQCPFCSRGAETIEQVKKKYGPNKVRIAFKHFPLPMHPEARPASEASQCIYEQNPDKFWKFHDLLFENQQAMSTEDLNKYAKQSGADMDKFKECFEGKKYAELVQSDLSYGEKIGVKSTPTFFINGQLVSGALPIESFSEIIDEELKAAKK